MTTGAVEVSEGQPGGHMVELHTAKPPAIAEVGPAAIIGLLTFAIEKGVPVEALEKLQAMHERAADRAAAVEFAGAMARFQAKCPPIAKRSTGNIVTKSGSKFSYAYAELDEIARTAGPILTECGLSYSWDSRAESGMLTCKCTVRHIGGHSVTAAFVCPVDTSAGMSEQQKYAAALTYGRRQSLIQALGLTTTDPDLDGDDPTSKAKITKEQADDLLALLQEVGVSEKRLLKSAGVEKVGDILAGDYATLVARVKATPAAAGAAKPERGDAAE